MKRIVSFVLLTLIFVSTSFAVPKTIDFLPPRSPDPTFSAIPQTLEEFLDVRDKLAYTPEGGATIFIIAMMVFTQNEKLGKQCFTIAMDKSQLIKNTGGYKGYYPSDIFKYYLTRLRDFPYIPYSYIQGSGPDQAYALPKGMFRCQFGTNPYAQLAGNKVKLYVSSTGTENIREITLIKNNRGVWKVKEFNVLFGNVARPAVIKDDDL